MKTMIMTYKEVYEYLKVVREALNKKPISNENAIQINDLAIKAVEKQIPKRIHVLKVLLIITGSS